MKLRYLGLILFFVIYSCEVSKDLTGIYEYKEIRVYHSLELLPNGQFIYKELDGLGAGLHATTGMWQLEKGNILFLKGDQVNKWYGYIETIKNDKQNDEIEIIGFTPSIDDERITMTINNVTQEIPKVDTLIKISKVNSIRFNNKIDNSLINEKIINENEYQRFKIEVIPDFSSFYFGEKRYTLIGNKLKSQDGLVYVRKR